MKIAKLTWLIGAAIAVILTSGTTWADGWSGPGHRGQSQGYHHDRAPHYGPHFKHPGPYGRAPHYGPKYFYPRQHHHLHRYQGHFRPYGQHRHRPQHRPPVYGGYGRYAG